MNYASTLGVFCLRLLVKNKVILSNRFADEPLLKKSRGGCRLPYDGGRRGAYALPERSLLKNEKTGAVRFDLI